MRGVLYTYRTCVVCQGKGRISRRVCPKCDGFGKILVPPRVARLRQRKETRS